MKATDRIRNKTNLLRSTQISASIYSRTKTYQVPIINTRANTLFFRLSSSITGIITATPRHLE